MKIRKNYGVRLLFAGFTAFGFVFALSDLRWWCTIITAVVVIVTAVLDQIVYRSIYMCAFKHIWNPRTKSWIVISAIWKMVLLVIIIFWAKEWMLLIQVPLVLGLSIQMFAILFSQLGSYRRAPTNHIFKRGIALYDESQSGDYQYNDDQPGDDWYDDDQSGGYWLKDN